MFCPNCGKEVSADNAFCSGCGGSLKNQPTQTAHKIDQRHSVPKCTCCGYVGEWKPAPILRPLDYILGIVFMFLGIAPGIIYLVVVAANRSKPENREKICPNCNAKNLWTFIY